MLRGMRFTILLGCIGLLVQTADATGPQGDARSKRPVTVADVIGMTNIGDSSSLISFTNEGSPVQFSPDGSKFAFVTQKGDLKNDTVEFSLFVFRSADAFSSPHPEVVATFASSSNRQAISRVSWLNDNDTLVFLGEQPGKSRQLFRVSSTTKQITQLTKHPTAVLAYAMSDGGDTFVYLAEAAGKPAISSEMLRRGFFMTSQRWDDLYTAGRDANPQPGKEIFVKTSQLKAPQRVGDILATPDSTLPTQGLRISPNRKYALMLAYNIAPPAIWAEYNPEFNATRGATACTATDAYSCPLQYLLLDLQKKTIEPLIDAPVARLSGGRELFAWTQENSLLLVNALLPLDSVDAKERNERRTSIYAVEIVLPEKRIIKIAQSQTPFHAFEIQSGTQRDQFVTQSFVAAYGPPLEIRRETDGWKITETSPAATELGGRLSVTLDQEMNSPPVLVANDTRTKQKSVLLDLNPQFAQLTFGRVEAFKWKTRDGHAQEGALYFPPDYVVGKHYPLVIQTHGYRRDRFWPDGPFTTAFAAQPLANHGFFVLQVPTASTYATASTIDEEVRIYSTPAEGPYFTAVFESAIDELDRLGLVDPTRVGLSGFSRTVYHVLYALTHSAHHFAAAVEADGVNFGYADCIYYLAKGQSSLCEKMNGGGPPFGASLAGWAKESPTFRLDKIEAPLLLQGILGPIGEWEILAGLRWLKKPVEMLNFYPEGEHILVRPQQRLLSQGSVVDWYCFWLKGEEDPDPAKAEQYKRWRELRKLQERDAAAVSH